MKFQTSLGLGLNKPTCFLGANMNIGTAKTALGAVKKAYGSYTDYRDRQAVKAYEALLEAANNYDIKGRFDDSTQRFNTLC